MGAVIIQDRHPIAYWSKKLLDSQKGYNTTEKELVAVVMCMKEYHNILYSGVINVYTDHGKEFIGSNFVRLLAQMGIKDVCTAVRYPQSNAICEQMH